MPKDCKKVTTNSITNIDYTKKYTSLNETILLHDTVIDGKLEVDGKVKVDGKLDVEGKLSLEGKLEVSGLSDLNTLIVNEKLSVLDDTSLHNTIIDGSLNAVNIIFSDNTIQTTAYVGSNSSSKMLPYYYGNIGFNMESFINSPAVIFDNLDLYTNKSIILKLFILVESSSSANNYSGYIKVTPSSIDNGNSINILKIPYNYNNSLATYAISNYEKDNNICNEISNVSISITKNTNENKAKLLFKFDKVTPNKTYYINCAVLSGSIEIISNTIIQNTNANSFSIYN